jgi:hypothetical protein
VPTEVGKKQRKFTINAVIKRLAKAQRKREKEKK